MKALIVIDMQNDFIDGALGTAEAQAIVPYVKEKTAQYRSLGLPVIFTRDTHGENYLETQEGRNLPVPHCLKGTHGWEITSELDFSGCEVFDKPTFGCVALAEYLKGIEALEEVELVGLCTDICVISNAMLIKANLTELKVSVDSKGCAGVTPESHKNALNSMKMCQIEIR